MTQGLPISNSAPQLTHAEIERELHRIFSKDRRSRLVALYGQGEPGVIGAQGHTFQVVPTRCELDLRANMPAPAERHDPGIVFLVDWTDQQLPQDLAWRMAGGRMHRIASDARLAVLFGARATDPELPFTALAKVLLAGGVTDVGKISGQVLRRQEAYRKFLVARVGFFPDGDLTTERLIEWGASNDKGPTFASHAKGEKTWDDLRDEVAAFLKDEAGVLGSIAWQAWLAGQGERFLELCLVLDAVAPQLGSGNYVEGLLKGRVTVLAPEWGAALLAQAKAIAGSPILGSVLDRIESASPERASALLDRADNLIDDAPFRSALGASVRLPSGFAQRTLALENALITLVKLPTPEMFAELCLAHDALRAHRHHRRETRQLEQQRQMILRLACYLVHRKHGVQPPAVGPDYQAALDLAQRYVAEGAWVDWARQHVRGLSIPALAQGVSDVLMKVDALRREDDRLFANALVKWFAAGKPSSQVLPISDVAKRVISELLHEEGRRKLLVLLLDGMSWANALELLDNLGNEPEGWGRACWRPKPFRGSLPAGSLPPVFASLPTLTQVSRAAFFAGKDDPSLGNEPSAKDPARWAANQVIQKLMGDGKDAVLMLKDGLMAGGAASEAVKEKIAGDDRIVAVVVNAIDDQLKGSKQLRVECSLDHIKPLRELLGTAESAGRAVLLVSDHGHVPGDVLRSRGQTPDGHARWRVLAKGEQPKEFEVVLPTSNTWRPKATAAVAAIWDDTACYGDPKYGEHGGVSLAEVIAPLVLIAPQQLAGAGGRLDEGLRVTPLPEPDWWRLVLPATVEVPVAAPAQAKPKNPGPQLALPIMEAPQAPPVPEKRASLKPPEPSEPEIIELLKKAPAYKAHVKGRPLDRVDNALRVLALVASAGDRMPLAEFARLFGVPPFQAGSAVVRASEILNADQYPILSYDRTGQQVVLDRAKLVQVFEVKS